MVPTVASGTWDDSKIGSISSEVDRNTARSVPMVMVPAAYKLEAAPENPHWGTKPNAAPRAGPAPLDRWRQRPSRPPAWCSRYSMSKYVKNKIGRSLPVSTSASNRASSIDSMSPFRQVLQKTKIKTLPTRAGRSCCQKNPQFIHRHSTQPVTSNQTPSTLGIS